MTPEIIDGTPLHLGDLTVEQMRVRVADREEAFRVVERHPRKDTLP